MRSTLLGDVPFSAAGRRRPGCLHAQQSRCFTPCRSPAISADRRWHPAPSTFGPMPTSHWLRGLLTRTRAAAAISCRRSRSERGHHAVARPRSGWARPAAARARRPAHAAVAGGRAVPRVWSPTPAALRPQRHVGAALVAAGHARPVGPSSAQPFHEHLAHTRPQVRPTPARTPHRPQSASSIRRCHLFGRSLIRASRRIRSPGRYNDRASAGLASTARADRRVRLDRTPRPSRSSVGTDRSAGKPTLRERAHHVDVTKQQRRLGEHRRRRAESSIAPHASASGGSASTTGTGRCRCRARRARAPTTVAPTRPGAPRAG